MSLLFQSDRTRQRVDEVSRTDFRPFPLDTDQRRLLALLSRHYGAARAISIAQIGLKLQLVPREVKQMVSDLRKQPFRVPVCSSRDGKGGGYYLAETDDERRAAGRLLVMQAVSMLRTAHDLMSAEEISEAFGQIRIALEGAGDGK